ncbi:MAG: hypothetical protein KAS30_01325, partial [Candidatus Diapherotrites archaeon]|nr:hypothetical protein [Candidatus Diapherotrites archaeon]
MTDNYNKETKHTQDDNQQQINDASEEIWKINPEYRKKGTWWWWFWLFFIDEKNDQKDPEQLMVLWSTKNDPQIVCNEQILELDSKITISENKNVFKGAVAAWYFDGKEMHENYVLENCNMTLDAKNRSLIPDLNENTTFSEKDNKFTVKINKDGKEFTFVSDPKEPKGFSTPNYSQSEYFKGRFSHNIIRVPKIKFTGSINDKKENRTITGTAYFQKVTVNAPAAPWYWGIFHFEDGSTLSYFNPY